MISPISLCTKLVLLLRISKKKKKKKKKKILTSMHVFDNLYVYLYQVDDQELAIVFMKVDANCDGTVDWVRDGFLIIVLIFGVGRLVGRVCLQ